MKKITYMLAGASLLAITGSVIAEPVALSEAQMDGVSAGGVYLYQGAAIADAGAAALSNLLGLTGSRTDVDVQPTLGYVTSTGVSGAVASSAFSPALGAANGAGASSAAAASSSLF